MVQFAAVSLGDLKPPGDQLKNQCDRHFVVTVGTFGLRSRLSRSPGHFESLLPLRAVAAAPSLLGGDNCSPAHL